jgi:hypothetical protein
MTRRLAQPFATEAAAEPEASRAVTDSGQPIRVLHLIGDMGGGDAQWLMNVLRYADRDRFRMDLLFSRQSRHTYDDEIRACGVRILRARTLPHPRGIFLGFHELLRRFGPYDVVHSHLHHTGGTHYGAPAVRGFPFASRTATSTRVRVTAAAAS